ncbi:MAG: multiheme c-type cytochrome [Candidatus Poribacteria bacterium]|nr:multiheme c-type cytochrome [Candidatus Poribacteria bacterium]
MERSFRRAMRLGWIVGAFGVGLGVLGAVGCGGAASPPSTPTAQETTAPKTVSFHSDNETCNACHTTIYKDWLTSRHAQAWKSETFRIASDNYAKAECLTCHAPDLILRTGLAAQPTLRPDERNGGVTCIVCHQDATADEWVMHGPYDDAESPAHGIVANAEFQTANVCASCHGQTEQFDQFHSWRESSYGEAQFPCQVCHMPANKGFMADTDKTKPERWIASHAFPGAHNEEFVKAATAISGQREGDTLVVEVENQAGHLFPGGAYRTAILTVKVGETTLGKATYSYESGNRIASGARNRLEFSLANVPANGEARAELRFYKIVASADGGSVVSEPDGVVISEATISY